MKHILPLTVLSAALVSGCVCRNADRENPAALLIPAARHVSSESGCIPSDTPVKSVIGEIAEAPAAVRDQAYKLDITPDGITMTASGRTGERFAEATLAQLKKLSCDGKLPVCSITVGTRASLIISLLWNIVTSVNFICGTYLSG